MDAYPHLAWRGLLKLTTLTPVHIGSGEVLNRVQDYDWRDNRYVRLDMEAFLRDGKVTRADKETWIDLSPSLTDKRRAEIRAQIPARYHLSAPAGGLKVTEVREAIKTGGRPYLPASSVKGALRTALMWELLLGKDGSVWDMLIEKSGEMTERRGKQVPKLREEFRAQPFEDCLFRGAAPGARGAGRARRRQSRRAQDPRHQRFESLARRLA
ncbi:MAG: type III-A CRISPR-associated RAMP protein Csm5 [Candidatus Sumerlaeota bacterium]|nr:type III-A CRISPR-associated RAMP protein Csm5 [Candidatus Sumerlaeota bacterium]